MSGILVVGAAGLIGRAVLAEARLAGDAHATVARATDSLPDAHLLRLSFGEAERIARLLERLEPAAIVSCAGRTSGGPDVLRSANVDSVAALLEAMRSAAPRARLVHVGSAAEYAAGAGDLTSEDAPVTTATPYAASKVAASRLVAEAADGGLDAVVARVFNPIGAGMPATSLPGRAVRLLRGAVDRGAAEIELGPLDAVRDYVDLRDVATALRTLATEPSLAYRAYNVGTGRPTLVRDLVRLIADRVGFAGRIRETAAVPSPGVARQVADTARLRSTGWEPAVDLDGSVDALVSGADG